MKKLQWDRILGLSAILISLLTLIIFIYQTNIIHRQSRLSVTPRIGFSSSLTEQDTIFSFKLILKNNGIGPAIINDAKIVSNGKDFPVDLEIFFEEEYPKLEELGSFTSLSSIQVGQTIPAGESLTLFTYKFLERNVGNIQEYINIGPDDDIPFTVILRYASIYEEEWEVESDAVGHPKKLR